MGRTSYNGLAWIYESLGQLYSGGQIYAAKASQVAQMGPGDAVLYAGVGPGEDAILAGQCGAQVTCIDVAPKMLQKVAFRFRAAEIQPEMICGNVLDHKLTGRYDVVVANFFLNVFAEDRMAFILKHLASLVKPGGKLLIADFTAPSGNRLASASQAFYWGVTNFFYYLLRLCAWHPVYDYPRYFSSVGLEFQKIDRFPVSRFGPQGFCAITAVRCPTHSCGSSQRLDTAGSYVASPAIHDSQTATACS
jgi:demethylphylloquinol methyltransferase